VDAAQASTTPSTGTHHNDQRQGAMSKRFPREVERLRRVHGELHARRLVGRKHGPPTATFASFGSKA